MACPFLINSIMMLHFTTITTAEEKEEENLYVGELLILVCIRTAGPICACE